MTALVRIDVDGMREVVRSVEQAAETLRLVQSDLFWALEGAELDTSETLRLATATTWAEEELPGLRRRYALAQALEGTEPTWAPGTVQLSESQISTVEPDLAVRQGRAAADELLAVQGRPPADLLARLEAGMADPYFASGLASSLTPDDLARLVLRWSAARTPADPTRPADAQADANAWYGRALTAVSSTLGTATRATGELARPAGYAAGWVKALTATVPGDLVVDATGRPDHANALGLLLGAGGTFSHGFLGTVATGVYEYERAYAREHPGDLWESRSGDPGGPGVVDAAGREVRDPWAGIMGALARVPVAAQDFFSGGSTTDVTLGGATREVPERLRYVLLERDSAVTVDEAVGAALVAATTRLRTDGGDGLVSATLAAQTLALLGQEAADAGTLRPGLTDGAAAILASYGADVHRVLIMDGDDLGTRGWAALGSGPFFPDDMPYGASLDEDLLAALVGRVGQDADAFTTLLAGAAQAGNLTIATGLQRAMENPAQEATFDKLLAGQLDHANASITRAASVMGRILDLGYEGALIDQAQRTAQAEAVARALSLVAVVPFVPEITSDWLELGAGHLATTTTDAAASPDPDATYADLQDEMDQRLTRALADQMLLSGLLGEVVVTERSADGVQVDVNPDGDFSLPSTADAYKISAGAVVGFDANSKAFAEWLLDSPLYSFLSADVAGPFLDQMGFGR